MNKREILQMSRLSLKMEYIKEYVLLGIRVRMMLYKQKSTLTIRLYTQVK